jgi:hypothetical protein
MTRRTNARVAGVTYLVYIAAGVAPMAIAVGQVVGLALSFVMGFSALVLGVTLYAITQTEDPDLAMLALSCRVCEAVLGAIFISSRFAVLPPGTAPSAALNAETLTAINGLIRSARGLNVNVGATFFAVASTLFAYLLLRGRIVPRVLGWLGVIASAILVVCLPAQLAGVLPTVLAAMMWLPALVFEVWLAFWLILKVS